MAVANPSAGIFDALFYNSGTYASPTLVKIDGLENLTFDDDRNVIPLKIRRYMTELNLTGQMVKKLSFGLMTEPGGTVWDAIHAAYNNRTAIEIFAFYKYTDNSGSPSSGDKAIRLNCKVSKFSRNQELEAIDMNDVELVPSARLMASQSSVHEPDIYTVS